MSVASLLAGSDAVLRDPNNGHGQAVTYTPPGGGAPVAINAIFIESDGGGVLRRDPSSGETLERLATVECPLIVGGQPQTYDVGGEIAVGEETWRVFGLPARDANTIKLDLKIPGQRVLRRNRGPRR